MLRRFGTMRAREDSLVAVLLANFTIVLISRRSDVGHHNRLITNVVEYGPYSPLSSCTARALWASGSLRGLYLGVQLRDFTLPD